MGKKKKAAEEAARIERERIEREQAAKAKKKAKGKGDKKKSAEAPANVTPIDRHRAHLDRVELLSGVVNDPDATKKARKAAQAELDQLRAEGQARIDERDAAKAASAPSDTTDAEIAARVSKKAAGSKERTDKMQADVAAERTKRELMRAGNPEPGTVAHTEITNASTDDPTKGASSAARADELGKMKLVGVKAIAVGYDLPVVSVSKDDLIAAIIEREERDAGKYDGEPGAIGDPSVPESLRLPDEATAEVSAARGDAKLDELGAEGLQELASSSTEVQEIVKHAFSSPTEVTKAWEDDVNGLGQYKVARPSDGKVVGYTRTTTYISGLEHEGKIVDWKLRTLLVGIAVAEEQVALGERREAPLARVRDLTHVRDSAIAKARKQDRKGKLVPGQLAVLIETATKTFKRDMDSLVDELFEVGGGREKAQKGTDLHGLTEVNDEQGIDAVKAKLAAEEITPADLADIEAYDAAKSALGLKVVAQEMVVVNDELCVGGRLDRIYLAKLPEIRDPKTNEVIKPADTRAKRYVGDVKTGNVEFGKGKIAQQIRFYAEAVGYDPETHERKPHGANKDWGILVHLPAGKAECLITIVDLRVGKRGNDIIAQVREFRNSGKKAFDTKIDLVKLAAETKEKDA